MSCIKFLVLQLHFAAGPVYRGKKKTALSPPPPPPPFSLFLNLLIGFSDGGDNDLEELKDVLIICNSLMEIRLSNVSLLTILFIDMIYIKNYQ